MNPALRRQLLLDMLSTMRVPRVERFAGLDDGDWQALQRIAHQHRLAPMLHHRFAAAGEAWPVPAAVRTDWEARFRRAAARSLLLQRALVAVQALLDREGIASAALKGAWLAWQAYGHPALRPMRDIDLLVADADAERAHAILATAGARPAAGTYAPAGHARAHHKHLAPLSWGEPPVAFEIHWRLSHPEPGEDAAAVAAATAALLARRVEVPLGGTHAACLDPTDTLLHLIVHAAYDHRFDNGPVVLADVAALVARADVDWHRFWTAAKGHEAGAMLIFALAETYHGTAAHYPEARPAAPPPEALAAAEALMLKEMDRREEVYFETAIAGARGPAAKAALLLGRAFPPRHILAHYAGRRADDRALWLWYPLRLADHGWRYLRRRGDPGRRASVANERALTEWLGGH